jgi:hypothetical protein
MRFMDIDTREERNGGGDALPHTGGANLRWDSGLDCAPLGHRTFVFAVLRNISVVEYLVPGHFPPGDAVPLISSNAAGIRVSGRGKRIRGH